MNDYLFTPALILCGIVVGSFLGYLELLWLMRPFHLTGSWQGLLLVALVNVGFIYLLVAIQNSYLFLFIFPVPVIPIAYVVLKLSAYYAVQRVAGSPVHSPWKLVFLSLIFHGAVFGFAYGGFARINPTRSNLEKAIREKNNGLLEVMLWMSVKVEPDMTILVNEAINSNNDDAVRRLIRRGADPRRVYWLPYASRETQWRLTKWMLDKGVKIEDLPGLNENPYLTEIAVGYSVVELEYYIQKGFEPRKHPGVIYAALHGHPLREHHVIQPDEVQALNDKILLLLRHGADINGKGEMGFTPIFGLLSLNLDLAPVLTLLIKKGADVNARSPNKLYPENSGELPVGLTPLMLAVIEKHPQYVAILMKYGADRTIRDANGFTALDYAGKFEADDATIRLLQ